MESSSGSGPSKMESSSDIATNATSTLSSEKALRDKTFYLDASARQSVEGPIVRRVESVALATAEVQQKISPFSKGMLKLYMLFLVPFVWNAGIGYTSAISSGLYSNTNYKDFQSTISRPRWFQVTTTLIRLTGPVLMVPLVDLGGRRAGIITGTTIVSTARLMYALSKFPSVQLVADHIYAFGGGIMWNSIVIYSIEIAHPSYRGPLLGLMSGCFLIGQLPGTFIAWATFDLPGEWAWRTPAATMVVIPVLVILATFFIPETPRWYMANNRFEEAHAFLTKYHGDGNPNAPIVQLELDEMKAEISVRGSDKRWWDYKEVFNTREARRRLFQSTAMCVITGWAGSSLVTSRYSEMLQGVGITDSKTPFLIAGIQTPIQWVATVVGSLLTDRIGRRRQLMIGSFCFGMIFCIITILNATNVYTDESGVIHAKSLDQAKAFMAMVFLFGMAFCFFMTPLQILYTWEPLRYEVRAKSMAAIGFLDLPFSFYSQYVPDIAWKRAGWKYYLFFVFWNLFIVGLVYFFFVETSNRTLEELNYIFQSKYPVKTSLSKSKIVIDGDLIVHHLDDDVPNELL